MSLRAARFSLVPKTTFTTEEGVCDERELRRHLGLTRKTERATAGNNELFSKIFKAFSGVINDREHELFQRNHPHRRTRIQNRAQRYLG
jgi:hypothetical protein